MCGLAVVLGVICWMDPLLWMKTGGQWWVQVLRVLRGKLPRQLLKCLLQYLTAKLDPWAWLPCVNIQTQSNVSSLFIFSVSSSLANFKAAVYNLWHFLCHCNTAASDKFISYAKLKCGDGVLLSFNFILVNFCCIHRCVPGVPRTLNGDQLKEIFSTETSWANIFRVAMKDKFKLRLQGKSPTGKPRWEYLGGILLG